MPVTLLPCRVEEYTSELNDSQIGETLSENVLTGFSLFDFKPYYGGFTSYGFSVRRTRGRLKRQSLAPGIEGTYGYRNGLMRVSITLRPHPVLFGTFLFLSAPMVVLWGVSIVDFVRTLDPSGLIGGLIPSAALYAGLWLVFQAQSSTDLRFWKSALRLREVRA